MRNKSAIRMISTGRVSEATLDENVPSVLGMVNRAIASGIGFDVASSYEKDPYMVKIMRRAASDAVVLLKNDKNMLPLSVKDLKKSYALIGSNVTSHTQTGGGSVAVLPTHVVTIWDGVRNALDDETTISFAQGCQKTKLLPPLLPHLRVPSNGNAPGLLVEMFNDNPWEEGRERLDPVHSAHEFF
ncbi:hypothetical protein BJX66DRAFT_345014 [Aspergillus keveii]|uniref:beta-glucosidase n=1 Tax=Aspergillus keveii TaxID=714993 RepID=A0ABR4FJD2_9EURO